MLDEYADNFVGRTGGRQYEVVILDVEPKALRGGRYLSILEGSPTKCAIRRNAQFLIPPPRFFQLFNHEGLHQKLSN